MSALVSSGYPSQLWVEWGGSEANSKHIEPSLGSLRIGAKVKLYARGAFNPKRGDPLLIVTYYGDEPPDVLDFEDLYQPLPQQFVPSVISPLLSALSLPTRLSRALVEPRSDLIFLFEQEVRRSAMTMGGIMRMSQWVIGLLLASYEEKWKKLKAAGFFADESFGALAGAMTGVGYTTWRNWLNAADMYILHGDELPELNGRSLAEIMGIPIGKAIRTLGAAHRGDMSGTHIELLFDPAVTEEGMRAALHRTPDELKEARESYQVGDLISASVVTRSPRHHRLFNDTEGVFFIVQRMGDGSQVLKPVLKVLCEDKEAMLWITEIVSRTGCRVWSPPEDDQGQRFQVVVEQLPQDMDDG